MRDYHHTDDRHSETHTTLASTVHQGGGFGASLPLYSNSLYTSHQQHTEGGHTQLSCLDEHEEMHFENSMKEEGEEQVCTS